MFRNTLINDFYAKSMVTKRIINYPACKQNKEVDLCNKGKKLNSNKLRVIVVIPQNSL